MINKKLLIGGVSAVILLIVCSLMNPVSWNDAGNRTVVEQAGGRQFIEFTPGMFYAGFFSKQTEWPNQVSVSYMAGESDLSLKDNAVEIGKIK